GVHRGRRSHYPACAGGPVMYPRRWRRHDPVHRRSTSDLLPFFGMKILQITDPHLYGHASAKLRGVETDSTLRNVLDEAFTEVPDYAAILVSGDVVQGDPAGYLRFCSIFGNCPKPVLCIPGNHDEPEAMRRALSGPPFQICGTYRA